MLDWIKVGLTYRHKADTFELNPAGSNREGRRVCAMRNEAQTQRTITDNELTIRKPLCLMEGGTDHDNLRDNSNETANQS